MVDISGMQSDAIADGQEDKRSSKGPQQMEGADDDVYFFNPWDRHFDEDRKSQISKFDF
nr:hypothetical protein [uncultured Shinella sp.]